MESIKVIKRNAKGEIKWQYTGQIISRFDHGVKLAAFFDLPDAPFLDTSLKKGDRFIEWYYTDRWYNVFEIHDRDDDRLKGWYCNIGRPMIWEDEQTISYIDLALDLWISVDGSQTLLDEDEYAALSLDDETREKVSSALNELKKFFAENGKWVDAFA